MSSVVRESRTRSRRGPAGIVAGVFAISALHYFTGTNVILVHEILRRLYYLPIVVAAINYGLKGGLAISLLSSAFYLPHIVLAWGAWPTLEVDRYGEIVLFNVIAAVTGVMADRLRSERNRYRRASEELETAYGQLKTTVDERVKAERLASVGRAAAGMAHEIRTPLSAILGCFEICCGDYPPEHPKREFLEILKREVERVERVVATFLDFAQPPLPNVQSVELNDIARGTARLVASSFAEGRVAIDVTLDSRSIVVAADAHLSQRALLEVLLAAASLVPRGTVKLRTSTDQDSVATISVVVEPIEQDLPSDVFEPFVDGYAAQGLMLPLSRRLIENQGGNIRAWRRDRCIEFVIQLPISKSTEDGKIQVPARIQ